MTRGISKVFQFKIILNDITPLVWRLIEVPEKYSFWDLHVAIQDAMGWEDYHLHSFDMADPVTGKKVTIGIPSEDFYDEIPTLPGWEVNIKDYFNEQGVSAEYLYDFGDGWEHTVRLEDIVHREKGMRYPRCVAGERHCPPEDCGGVGGYENFLEVIRDPEDEDHEAMLEWIGGSFDPESFDARKVKFDNPDKRWDVAFGGEIEF